MVKQLTGPNLFLLAAAPVFNQSPDEAPIPLRRPARRTPALPVR
jgi:hypothetical protein